MQKVAIVTGASRGIGRAIALALAQRSFAVLVNYAGSMRDAEDAVAAIIKAGGTAIAFKADVSSPTEVAAMFHEAERRFGGVDVLVNNAGVMAPSKLTDATDEDSTGISPSMCAAASTLCARQRAGFGTAAGSSIFPRQRWR